MGFELKIERDEDPLNPRVDFVDNVGRMVCWHRRYSLGDEDASKKFLADPDGFLKNLKQKRALILPLFLYDHGGITMKTTPFSCPWDSGKVGFIYCLPEDGRREWGRYWKKKARAYLEGEVETYDKYLTGDVWGYIIEENGKEIDSCWGYFGEEDCKAAGEMVLKRIKEDDFKEHGKQEDMLEKAGK